MINLWTTKKGHRGKEKVLSNTYLTLELLGLKGPRFASDIMEILHLSSMEFNSVNGSLMDNKYVKREKMLNPRTRREAYIYAITNKGMDALIVLHKRWEKEVHPEFVKMKVVMKSEVDIANEILAEMKSVSRYSQSVQAEEGIGADVNTATAEIRDWGRWESNGKDVEDDDFQTLSLDSSRKLRAIQEKYQKKYPKKVISLDANEKNWISIYVAHKR